MKKVKEWHGQEIPSNWEMNPHYEQMDVSQIPEMKIVGIAVAYLHNLSVPGELQHENEVVVFSQGSLVQMGKRAHRRHINEKRG